MRAERFLARKDASAREVPEYYKQFAEEKHLKYKSSFDNEVFDLVDLRKVKPRSYVTGRWCLPSRRTNKVTSSRRRQDGC